jgi:predicted nucleotidyltransferase
VFQKLIAHIAASLTIRKIPYMISGGQAVLLYGEPRLTRDIDVTIGEDISRLPDLLRTVDDTGLTPLPDDVESFVRKTMILPVHHEDTGVRVDFTFSLSPYTIEAIARAHKVAMEGQEVAFTSVEDLVIHKVIAGRARDLEDVRSVLLRNSDVDTAYITKWLKKFDESTEDGRFTGDFQKVLTQVQ